MLMFTRNNSQQLGVCVRANNCSRKNSQPKKCAGNFDPCTGVTTGIGTLFATERPFVFAVRSNLTRGYGISETPPHHYFSIDLTTGALTTIRASLSFNCTTIYSIAISRSGGAVTGICSETMIFSIQLSDGAVVVNPTMMGMPTGVLFRAVAYNSVVNDPLLVCTACLCCVRAGNQIIHCFNIYLCCWCSLSPSCFMFFPLSHSLSLLSLCSLSLSLSLLYLFISLFLSRLLVTDVRA